MPKADPPVGRNKDQSLHEVASYARFSQFIRSPRRTLLYAGDMLRHRNPAISATTRSGP